MCMFACALLLLILPGYSGDVWDTQPAPKYDPWRKMPNHAMTAHTSGTTLDAQVGGWVRAITAVNLSSLVWLMLIGHEGYAGTSITMEAMPHASVHPTAAMAR